MILAIIAASLALFFFLWTLFAVLAGGKNDVNVRMRQYAASGNIQDSFRAAGQEGAELDSRGYLAPLFKLSRFFTSWSQIAFFDKQMQLAGIALRGSEFISISLLSAFIIFVLALVLLMNVLQAGIITGVWLVAVWYYIRRKIKKRNELFNQQLCEAIGMMSNAMKSGFSFLQTLDLIAKEMKPPISLEFARTLREMQLGMSMEEAMSNLSARVQSEDLDLVLTAVVIQRQVGGNMSKVLDNIGNTIIGRVKIQGEIRTLTAEGRMSGYVVAAMPFIMSAIFLLIDPKYFDEFLKHPFGIMAIAVGMVMQIIGILIIRKIVDIKL